MPLEVRTEVEERLRELERAAEQQRYQEAADASVPVAKRVDCLKLVVDQFSIVRTSLPGAEPGYAGTSSIRATGSGDPLGSALMT
jgi:hypothetical protein